MSELKRTTFETSRAGEYFDARELQAQTGQPSSNFVAVALKHRYPHPRSTSLQHAAPV